MPFWANFLHSATKGYFRDYNALPSSVADLLLTFWIRSSQSVKSLSLWIKMKPCKIEWYWRLIFPLEPPTAAHWTEEEAEYDSRRARPQPPILLEDPEIWRIRRVRHGAALLEAAASAADRSTGGNLHIPPCRSTIKGGEGGRAAGVVSGSERCHHIQWAHHAPPGIKAPGVGPLRTSTGHPKKPIVQPRGFGTRWRLPLEPALSAAWASIATISGSKSDTVDRPEGGNVPESSFPEWSDSPSNAGIDIWLSGGAPKDKSENTPRGASLFPLQLHR